MGKGERSITNQDALVSPKWGVEVQGGLINLRCIQQERFLLFSAFCNPPSLSVAARVMTYNLHPRASISPWCPNPVAGGKGATG